MNFITECICLIENRYEQYYFELTKEIFREIEERIKFFCDVEQTDNLKICNHISSTLVTVGVNKADADDISPKLFSIYKLVEADFNDEFIEFDEIIDNSDLSILDELHKYLLKGIDYDRYDKRIPFDDLKEFILFTKKHKELDKGYRSDQIHFDLQYNIITMMNCGLYIPAINYIVQCLNIGPIFCTIRLFLVNCLLMLNLDELAEAFLFDLKDYLYNEEVKAKYYIAYGNLHFIKDPITSCACYEKSLMYKDNENIRKDIEDIKKINNIFAIDINKTLFNKNIPIIDEFDSDC